MNAPVEWRAIKRRDGMYLQAFEPVEGFGLGPGIWTPRLSLALIFDHRAIAWHAARIARGQGADCHVVKLSEERDAE